MAKDFISHVNNTAEEGAAMSRMRAMRDWAGHPLVCFFWPARGWRLGLEKSAHHAMNPMKEKYPTLWLVVISGRVPRRHYFFTMNKKT